MIRLFFVMISIGLMANLEAQQIAFNLKTTEVKREKAAQRTSDIQAIGQSGEYVYYLFRPYIAVFNEKSIGSTENHFIGKYDKDLNLMKKAEIILTKEKKSTKFEGVYFINDQLILFSSVKNQTERKQSLYSQKVNKETLEPEAEIKLIGELDYSEAGKYKDTFFQFEVSDDKSGFMVFYTLLGKDFETLKFGMYLYDNKLNLKWKNDNVSPKFNAGVFSFREFKTDNSGNVYLLGINHANKENFYDEAGFRRNDFFSTDFYYSEKPNYTYQIYKYSGTGKELFADISIPGKFIRSMTFTTAANNVINCAGIFSAPGTISALGGFTFNFNIVTKQVNNFSSKEFGSDQIEQGFNEKELNRFRKRIENKEEWDPFQYLLSEIKTRQNGEKYFIAEQFIEGTKKEKSGNIITYKTIYMHHDAFIVNLTNNNQIKRIDKLSKRQYLLITDRFNSYTSFEKNGLLYFIFNTILYKDTMFKNAELGDSYIVSIDGKGVQKKEVFKTRESPDQTVFMPSTGITVSPGAIIYGLMSGNLKDYAFEKLTITD